MVCAQKDWLQAARLERADTGMMLAAGVQMAAASRLVLAALVDWALTAMGSCREGARSAERQLDLWVGAAAQKGEPWGNSHSRAAVQVCQGAAWQGLRGSLQTPGEGHGWVGKQEQAWLAELLWMQTGKHSWMEIRSVEQGWQAGPAGLQLTPREPHSSMGIH